MKKVRNRQQKNKISEMLAVLGDGFIQLGTTPEQRENYLRTIATAWNIAILDKGIHEKCIADSIDKFKQANKGDETHTDAYEENLRKLIDRKLSLFPSVKVQIINVRIFLEGGQEKISAVSMRM